MASPATRDDSIQIGLSLESEFLQDIPTQLFQAVEGKLHHDQRKVNVFTANKDYFANAYSNELKVNTLEEFALIKQRLLTLPIYMRVELRRHRKSGNTTHINYGTFIVMVNTKHPSIQPQLQECLDRAESYLREEQKFALEIDFGPVLRSWYKLRHDNSSASYIAKNSYFCITNFRKKSKVFVNPVWWILCLPVCLLAAPLYCAYRHALSEDFSCVLKSAVRYVEGTTPAQRLAMRNMIQAVYAQGVQHGHMTAATRPPQSPPTYSEAAPPSYNDATAPPYHLMKQNSDDDLVQA
uniref:Uncharacterized LOC100181832 n=1 Tax=Ciona intestinalis TaxID=7719 RepID=F7A5F3_CIOIN|nr:uncharacterized protein LOC100181832 [Ciona intestinalis]|eukprot:XP_002127814.1 uncharacterized protein LOC100181832 [Ciona intestinalis]